MHPNFFFLVIIQNISIADIGVRLLDKAPLRFLFDPFWIYSTIAIFSTCILISSLSASFWRVATRSQFRALSRPWRFAKFGNILLFVVLLSIQRSVWGEGSTDIMVSGGAALAAKQHDVEPEKISGSTCYANIPKSVRKRSYLRAARRAHRFGFTWYRGQLVTSKEFPRPGPSLPSSGSSRNLAPPQRQMRRRLTCLSWNAGGLSKATWDLTLQWIDEQNNIDLIMIQESHWKFTNEWTLPQYNCIHSGFSGKQAGLLCLISKRLCQSHQISWAELDPGRLVHIQLTGKHRNIDVLHLYQHVHTSDRLEQRQHLWDLLNTTLTSFSSRNQLLLLGDFNTSLPNRSLAVGAGTYLHQGRRHAGTVHSDSDTLHQILRQHSIEVLNTWNQQAGPTFVHDLAHSRIDYICCRRIHSDATSRDVKYLDDFPLFGYTGPQHFPLLTSVLRHWTPATSTAPSLGWSHKQRLALYAQWMRQDESSQSLQHGIIQKVRNITDSVHPLDDLHAALNSFPANEYATPAPPPVHRFDLTPFQAFRYHGQELRTLAGVSLDNMFKAWHHVSQQCAARRQMNATSKQARKAKLQLVLDQAHEAAEAKDHFRLYQAVRKLAPRLQHKRISLRNPDGTLASPVQAANLLQDWYTQLYADQALATTSDQHAWPFTEHELCQGFKRLPLMKSLAPEYAPAPFWVMGASDIAMFLQPFLEHWLPTHQLPQVWSRGSLVLLPKPGKPCQRPSDLRPISLLEPVGKIVLGMIAQHLLHGTWHILRTLPQYAYLPGRGCTDAIFRVQRHCQAIRDSLINARYQIHDSAAGLPSAPLLGGLLVSLDMSRAFDEVSRATLFESLHQMGVAPAVIDVLHQIYSKTTMTFHHRGEFREFDTYKGIRQGCKGAPIMWCIFTASLMSQLSSKCGWDHILRCLTAFADDFCHHQSFDSLASFELALTHVGHLMDCLESNGMILNTDKTVALCKYTGRQSVQLMKKHILRTKAGTFLRIPRSHGGFTHIKLVSEYTYLGVKISYGNLEWLTMSHRLKAGDRTQQHLHRWLHLKCGLSPHQKVKIWRQCVLSSMLHGLIHTGFGQRELLAFHRKCMQQLRRIFHEPVFITRESHADFIHRHRLVEPLQLLRALCEKTQKREGQRRLQLVHDDILQQHPSFSVDALIQAIDAVLHGLDHSISTQASTCLFECSLCAKQYDSQSALRRHLTQEHDSRSGPLRTAGDLADHEHRLRVTEFMHFSNAANFQALLDRPELLAYMSTHCILCGHYQLTSRGMLLHWTTEHADLFNNSGSAMQQLQTHHACSSPCTLCGTSYKRTHHCVILAQMALHQTLHRDHAAASVDTLHRCPHCPKAYVTKHGLRQHMDRYHRALTVTSSASAAQEADLYQHFCKAVETDDVRGLLNNPLILEFLGTRHVSLYRDSDLVNQYLLMVLFGRSGCLCNPGPHPGSPEHCCTSIRQLAMLFVLSGQPLLIPYPYKAQEILDILTPLMDPSSTMEVTFALHARRFGRLWSHRALRQMLKHNCLICQAPLDMEELHSHLLQEHQMEISRFRFHQRQLTKVLLPRHGAGDSCDWCHVHLEVDADSGGSDTNLQNHLLECPVVLQLAILLGHPAWDFAMADEFEWPSEEMRLDSHRRRELRLRQFYAQSSAMQYSTYLFLARCGLMMVADPWMKQHIQYTCLCCGKMFFSARPFLGHLMMEHNFHQLDTELCHMYLLSLQPDTTCEYCGSDDHALSPGRRCPALFNLAVALCHGDLDTSGGRCDNGCGSRHLEEPSQSRTNDGPGFDQAQRGAATQQATQDESRSTILSFFNNQLVIRSCPQDGSALDSTRGQPSGTNVPATVHSALWTGPRQHSSHPDGTQQILAPIGREEGAAQASSCNLHDADLAGTTPKARTSSTDGCSHPGLPQVPHCGQQSADAIPSMEHQGQLPTTDPGQSFTHPTGGQKYPEHPSPDDRSGHDVALSCAQEARERDQVGPMAVDGQHSAGTGTVALPEGDVLARFLATHPVRIKPQTVQRSPLAQEIQQLLQGGH
eukprot:s4171_g2.t1